MKVEYIQNDSEDTSSEFVLPELEDLAKLDKDTILYNNDLYDAIFSLESMTLRTDYINKLLDVADSKRILVKVRAKIKSVSLDYKKMNHNEVALADGLLPEGAFPPGATIDLDGWSVRDNGVSKIDGEKTIQACYHPIFPIKRMVDCFDPSKQKVTIAWIRPGIHGWRQATVPRSDISTARNITKLADYGVGVNSENAKGLVRFLSAFENKNYNLLEETRTTTKLGWNDGFFIPYERKSEDPIQFDGEGRPEISAITEHGDYDKWLAAVKAERQYKNLPMLMYLAGSFASVLVEKTDTLSFILSLYGQSGRGKTVALMMACSVWADPAEGEYIVGANATLNGIEFKLDFLNNMPYMVDDLTSMQLNKDIRNILELIYKVCGQQGKLRGAKTLVNAASKTWKNLTLTNAERPLLDDSAAGGAVNRVIDVPIGNSPMFKDARGLVSILRRNYGFAGRKFIEALRDMGDEKLVERFEWNKNLLLELAAAYKVNKEEKQIQPMALILTADQIAEEYIFKDGCLLDPSKCLEILKSVDEVSEESRAFEALLDVISGNMNRFVTSQNDKPIIIPTWGRIDATNHKVIMNYQYFKEEVSRLGFNPRQLLRWMAVNKNQTIDTDGCPPRQTILTGDARPRCVTIALVEQIDGFIKEEDSQDDVPFK